MVAESELNEWR